MKTLKNSVSAFLAIFVIVIQACQPESKPITYGSDKCEFCRMSVVDQRFGGEIVTSKGKVFLFDAVECMINYMDAYVENENKLSLILTNTCDNPGVLSDVRNCIYLKSKNMPSPMGMFINPFRETSEAVKAQKENTGEILTWDELKADFQKNKTKHQFIPTSG